MKRKWAIYTRKTLTVMFGPVGQRPAAASRLAALNGGGAKQYALAVAKVDEAGKMVHCHPARMAARIMPLVTGRRKKSKPVIRVKKPEPKPSRECVRLLQMELF